MTKEFKNLLLDRTELKALCEQFCRERGYSLTLSEKMSDRHRIVFLRTAGEQPATVDLLLRVDGTTTIQYKMAKNLDAGLELANFLKDSIDPDEQEVVNLLLKGFSKEKFDYLIEFLGELTDEQNDKEFDLTDITAVTHSSKFKIKSINHSDTLTITHYNTTNKLHLQGKPLFAYRQTAYILAEFLDLDGLRSVIYKQDASEQSVKINYGTIETSIRTLIPDAYDRLENKLHNMLKSCFAIGSLDIELPDYGIMVFPALKVLEATIRKLFTNKGIHPENEGHNLGKRFDRNHNGGFSLNQESKNTINCSTTITALENCYNFYYKQRHRLFHTSDFPDSSYVIEDKLKAQNLIEGTLKLVNVTYKAVAF